MKKLLNIILVFCFLFVFSIVCYAASYNGATTISSSQTLDSKSYTSTTGTQNALLVSGGTSTINSCTITKSGDSSDEDSDFYGTNAAVLVYNGATLNITGGTITTNGSHANAVFAYGTGIINISDASISTSSNNSGGIMVTGGGTLNANNLTVATSGNSSASIRSDRGGGTLTVDSGTYSTSGVGSPAIYSTADIKVSNATLTSTSSEGIVVEGANSVALDSVDLTDTNTTLNGNSETYKNIFLYQSMSGDANSGTATFSATNSNIVTNKGDSIFVTNTTATINLTNNTFTNNSRDFLRIQTGKWGNSGSNGGKVTLNMTNQNISGNIIVDSISTLAMSLKSDSVFTGSIDSDNQASKITLDISDDSVVVLTANSYIDTLNNSVTDNSNIYLNGYNLYVNGTKVSGNAGTYAQDDTVVTTASVTSSTKGDNSLVKYYIAGGVTILLIIVAIIVIIFKNKKRKATV